MESSFNRYIWKHTSRQQLWILFVVLISMIPYYLAFDLPKMLINGPIQGIGFESADSTQALFPGTFLAGIELDRMQMLIALSVAFLSLVVINGMFKYYINTYKGMLGERLLRRVRYELIDRILRFLPGEFKRIKGGEISSMVKDEVEPLGGFTSEAFVQPVLLGGQALTALAFIFVQHFWLGVVALVMASIQIVLIPRLRQRLLVLGRERQIGARQLAGKVTEIVDGIETIHTNDTSNYERADITSRLGNLFRIRFEIYSRKYKIKFLNNFLAQLTPFLFYLIGGYLAITGQLDVGQLVAVITAYKELPGPLKELIDWDLAKQDVQVKYEQIVDQFDAEEMIHPRVQALTKTSEAMLQSPLSAANITMEDNGGAVTLKHVSLAIEKGQSVALVGDAYSGANSLAEALAGINRPVKGKITAGTENLASLPESVTGRAISYASADSYFFSGSLEDNLLYGLKHHPLNDVAYSDEARIQREWELEEARRTGNPEFDINSEWIDKESVSGSSTSESFVDSMRQVLSVALLADDMVDFALHSQISRHTHAELAQEIVTLRKSIRVELEQRNLSDLVVPFDIDLYNSHAGILENILFGNLIGKPSDARHAAGQAYFNKTLKETGLDRMLFTMGRAIAEKSRALFQDLPVDHPFLDRMELMDLSELPQYIMLYKRTKYLDFDEVSPPDQGEWIRLTTRYIEPQYRFGLLDQSMMQKIVETRKLLHTNMPSDLRDGIEVYDSEQYLESANLLDNIIFGKVDTRFNDVADQLREVVAPLLFQQAGLYDKMYSVGLSFNVGPAGRSLSSAQRLKLNFARSLMRKSEFYIFNGPVSGLDQRQQSQIIRNTLAFFAAQGYAPAIIWVLGSEDNTHLFQRRITFKHKLLVEDKVVQDSSVQPMKETLDTV